MKLGPRSARLASLLLLASVPLGAGCAAEPASEAALDDELRGNNVETRFIRVDLLSAAEERHLDTLVRAGTIAERHGAMAIVYPDGRLPEAGDAVLDAVRSGRVKTLAFAGMPMTLKGSLNVAKYVAKVNREPVVAVHVGYGNTLDNGVYTFGPRAFFFERPQNASLAGYRDEAIEPVLAMLERLDPADVPDLRLVGYCLGAYKVANLVKRLGEKRPDVTAKMDLYTLGTGVRLPSGVKSAYQRGGNIDQFGRINSNEIEDVDVVAGADHFLRDDAPDGMRLLPFEEMAKRRALRAFVRAPDAETYLAAKRALGASDAALARAVDAEGAEAVSLGREADRKLSRLLLDDMHRAKLALWGARAKHAAAVAEGLSRGGRAPAASDLQALTADVRAKEKALSDLARGRSAMTDQLEYNAWRARQLFR